MNRKDFISLILALLILPGCAMAGDPQPQASHQEVMHRIQKLGTPGNAHRKLDTLAGTWTAQSKFWNAPDEKPQVSTAKVTRKWILDGRFIQENYIDQNKPYPFTGMGILGFDNLAKQYISTWVDTMSTSVSQSLGNLDKTGKNIAFHGEMPDLVSGKILATRSELQIVNKDTNIYKMFTEGSNGKEMKVLEIIYKRKN